MAYLTINGKEYEARTDFKFEKLANERYNEESDGQKIGGFMTVYFNLLQEENLGLLAFWDCALHHYKKDKPSADDLEEAVRDLIIEDADKGFSDAFTTLDKAGFFKKKVNTIWDEFTKAPEVKDNETDKQKEDREKQEEVSKMMIERRERLTSTK